MRLARASRQQLLGRLHHPGRAAQHIGQHDHAQQAAAAALRGAAGNLEHTLLLIGVTGDHLSGLPRNGVQYTPSRFGLAIYFHCRKATSGKHSRS
jgi:hypothetical protein